MLHTNPTKESPVICWWSGGITSAVACKLAIDLYGKENCRVIFIDTNNEDSDTYRFMEDCQDWYEIEIESISSTKFQNPEQVWYHYKSLNVANGAICSSELKREVRKVWQKENTYTYQVFGFDAKEPNRAISMATNYPEAKPVFPLLMYGIKKKAAIDFVQGVGIEVPRAYAWGFHNNNCLQTGCVQGGIGYWQKMQRDFPEKFERMAVVEHELSNKKGKPVTMCKDQSGSALASGQTLVFLKPHPDYPEIKDLSMMKGREPKPLMECNGFCGINDLSPRSETEKEINFEGQLTIF